MNVEKRLRLLVHLCQFEILGFSEVPQAGEIINGMDDNEARAIAEKRIAKQRVQELQATHKVTLDDIFNQIQQGELKDLNIIIKADVQGSVEALRQSLEGIKNLKFVSLSFMLP